MPAAADPGPHDATTAAEPAGEIRIRPAREADLPAVVALCAQALGWADGEPNEELFTWKHRANPFGPSPMWVAETEQGLAAVRAMLRWELVAPDGTRLRAVRAVDTATDRAHRGQGLFRRLTLGAVEALTAEGVDLVFNTPNAQSRPGYLTMGWEVLGRVPVAVGLPSLRAVGRLRGAGGASRKWSLPTSAGAPAAALVEDEATVAALVASAGPARGLATPRTPAHLRWRYAEGPVSYRVLGLGRDPAEGVALFRLRQRGGSTEAVVDELIVPAEGAAGRRRRLVARILREAGPDHLLVTCPSLRSAAPAGGGPLARLADVAGRPPALRAPRLGPILTWRALARPERPPIEAWDLSLGDVELF